ncbi:BTB/POZ protein [Rhizophagus irregularis DAOM 181602=DAOM 197198]|nr:BTB/POZ protein [Rhizophagus irregularis DAOM 181602=DAOM 197198]
MIILRYIYGGVLSLNGQDTLDVFKVLLAANELLLQELVDYLQNYLINNESQWMEQHFELIHRTSFQFTSLTEIQQFCTNLMAKSPHKIFKSLDFTSIPETSLVQVIKRDDLQMKEIDVWEHVLKWGIAQNPTLLEDPNTWSDNDFKTIENTLQHCLSFIRFFCLSSKEFLQKVHPYKKLLRSQFYEELLNSHLNPDSEPNDNISLPRNIYSDENHGIIDSTIVNLNIVSIISRWIDKVDVNHKNNLFKDAIISYVKNICFAALNSKVRGPYFGYDLIIRAPNESSDYDEFRCRNIHYERRLRDTEDTFLAEDYEVYQIVRK